MAVLKKRKKKLKQEKIINSVSKDDKIVIDGKDCVVIDVGNKFVVARDDDYNTYQFER